MDSFYRKGLKQIIASLVIWLSINPFAVFPQSASAATQEGNQVTANVPSVLEQYRNIADLQTVYETPGTIGDWTAAEPGANPDGVIQVFVDGNQLAMDVPPIIEQNHTLVPLRAIFEALGARVDWNAAEQSVTATKGTLNLKLTIGNPMAIKNGEMVDLEVPPRVVASRTLVPLQLVSSSLNSSVYWGDGQPILKIYSAEVGTTPVPTNAIEFYQQAITFCAQSQYEQAVPALTKAIELNPKYTAAYEGRGWNYFYLGQYENAIADFNKVMELDPQYAPAYYERGSAYYRLHKYDLALADQNKAIQMDPNLDDAYNARGDIYFDQGQFEKSIEDYSKAIQLNPKAAAYYCNRGDAYNRLKKYDLALADFNKAIEVSPKYLRAFTGRGYTYMLLGKFDQAFLDFNKGIELEPMNDDAYWWRGLYYQSLKQFDKAEADYTQAITLDPKSTIDYYSRAYLYNELGQYDKAIADCSKAIELNPKYISAYYERGYAYFKLGRYNEAIADYKKILEIDPANESVKKILRDMGVSGY